MNKLDFEIKESPIWYKNESLIENDSYKAIYRDDNSSLLSVMKESYNPLKVSDFKDISNKLQSLSNFEHMGYSTFRGGRIILSHLKNNQDNIRINGNKIDDYLILGSSFDGSKPIFIGTSTILVRCTNAFSRINKVNSIKHTKSSDVKLEELMKSIEIYFMERNALYAEFNAWNDVKVHSDQVEKLIKDIVSLDDIIDKNSTQSLNKAEAIKNCIITETNALGDNKWGVFNGLTKFSTHVLKQKDPVFGSIVGSAASFNSRAYKAVKEMAL